MRLFPIIYPGDHKFATEVQRLREEGVLAFVIAVPWRMIVQHEEQAKKNHNGYTISTLNSNGGLGAIDACAILEDRTRAELMAEVGSQDQAVYHIRLLDHISRFNLQKIIEARLSARIAAGDLRYGEGGLAKLSGIIQEVLS